MLRVVVASRAGSSLLKPGVSVQQIKLASDIPIPGASTQGVNKIPAGETVLVIRTPKGVYIRTPQGKIFAVRSTPKGVPEPGSEKTGGSGGGADEGGASTSAAADGDDDVTADKGL